MLERLKKISLANWIIVGGCIITICSIFCFFGKGVYYKNTKFGLSFESSLFDFMLGTNDTSIIYKLTIVFVAQIVISVICLLTIVLIFLGSSKKLITIFSLFSSLCMVALFILTLCTKSILLSKLIDETNETLSKEIADILIKFYKNTIFPDVKLSSGPISYAIMGSLSFLSLGTGLVLSNLNIIKKIKKK